MIAAYKLTQQLHLTQWLSDSMPIIEEEYARVGLLLLEHSFTEGRWQRQIEEYISDELYLAKFRNELHVARSELQKKHLEVTDQRSIEFALKNSLQIESDGENSNPTLLWSDDMPIPHHLLYLPTVTPRMPPNPVKNGESWKGTVNLEAKAFEFLVQYTITKIKQTKAGVALQVTIDENQKPICIGDEVQGILQPAGEWEMHLSENQGIPIWAKGFCSMSLRMKFRSMEGKDIDTTVLSSQNSFHYQCIPITFDENSINPAAWGMQK